MAIPPPVFTSTPVIAGNLAADMPQALGPKIGATTNANFATFEEWAEDLDAVTRTSAPAEATPILTARTDYSINAGLTCYTYRTGGIHALRGTVVRTGGAALVSNAVGTITTQIIADITAAVTPPQYTVFFVGRCTAGPFFNMYLTAARAIYLRGCSQPSYTYPTTFTIEFEIWWIP